MDKIRAGIDLEKILNIIALAFGIVALFFSWQANQIARRQLVPQLVAIQIEDAGQGWESARIPEGSATVCNHRIWLHNFGGAPASIIEVRKTFFYDGSEYEELSQIPGVLKSYHGFYDTDVLTGFDTTIAYEDPPSEFMQNFPILVPEFTTTIVLGRVRFEHDLDFLKTLDPFFFDSDVFGPNAFGDPDTYSPLYVQYQFVLPDGTIALTPHITCIYMRLP